MSEIRAVPKGNKLSVLDLGRMKADVGFVLRGGGVALAHDPYARVELRETAIIASVIEVPSFGPILFETGISENWPPDAQAVFPLTSYEERHHLDTAIAAAGYDIADIRAIVMGHLHLDHAGGLEHFVGTQIPVYAHEAEIKEAYYAIATKEDLGAYLPENLDLALNWQPIHREVTELFPGVTLRHMPGHTPGLLTVQVETRNSGHFMLTSDLYHVREQFEEDAPQGWLSRDSHRWWRSHRWMKQLAAQYDATMLFGHDVSTLEGLVAQGGSFD